MGVGQKNGISTSEQCLPRSWPQQQLAGGRMGNADILLLLGKSPPTENLGEMEPCVLCCSNLEWTVLAGKVQGGNALGSGTINTCLSCWIFVDFVE